MKSWIIILPIIALLTTLILLNSVSCRAATGDTYVWVSEDQNGTENKIGYFQEEERFTKIIATSSTTSNFFDMSFGEKIISFENAGGLYGELGADSANGKLNLLFGAGYMYENTKLLILAGPKYYTQVQKVFTEGQIFLKIFDPVILNVGYDTNSNSVFIGVGIKFH